MARRTRLQSREMDHRGNTGYAADDVGSRKTTLRGP